MGKTRVSTPIDQLAERWVDTLVSHAPTLGTYIGRHNGRLADYSPAGAESFAEAQRSLLTDLAEASPEDTVDEITSTDLSAHLKLLLTRHSLSEYQRDLNVIASPPQEIRGSFDLMPSESAEDWEQIAQRLRAVPGSLASYKEALALGLERGRIPSLKQVEAVASQARRLAGSRERPGAFGRLVSGSPSPQDLDREAAEASESFIELAQFLEGTLAPRAPERDAFGRDRYAVASEFFLGTRVNLDETYDWGLDEVKRIAAEQEKQAAALLGRLPYTDAVGDAVEWLDQDFSRKLHGHREFLQWMKETGDQAMQQLADEHFHIPDELKVLEYRITPEGDGGIFYTAPSDDFTRPGCIWWSVPRGVKALSKWRERTTIYHEGVPGHHLQVGTAMTRSAQLNEWRRLLAGSMAHAEGWALYAEKLMDTLGYLEDPADRLGLLESQRFRAARVVVDIGVHLQKRTPGGRATWNRASALSFLQQQVSMDDQYVKFELLRYLGWAGQAPAYAIGQRLWEELRDHAVNTDSMAGDRIQLREFHRTALSVGGVRLDTLTKYFQGDLVRSLPSSA